MNSVEIICFMYFYSLLFGVVLLLDSYEQMADVFMVIKNMLGVSC